MFLHLVVKSGKRYDTRSVLARRYRGGRGKEGDTLFSTSWERKEKNEKKGESNDRQNRTGPTGWFVGRLVCRQAGRQVCVVIMAAAFLLEMLEAPLRWINHPLKGTQVPNYILPPPKNKRLSLTNRQWEGWVGPHATLNYCWRIVKRDGARLHVTASNFSIGDSGLRWWLVKGPRLSAWAK